MSSPLASEAYGRIPFRLRLGVTGNRGIQDDERLGEVLLEQVRLVCDSLRPAAVHTPLRITLISQLAEGPDRFVVERLWAEAVARGEDIRLEVVLPADRQRYADVQRFDAASRGVFDELLERATAVTEFAGDPSTDEDWSYAYAAASAHVTERCDVLVALWDGRPSGGRGGTADTLGRAAARRTPCISILSGGSEPTVAAGPGAGTLDALRRELASLDTFNGARIDRARTRPDRLGLPGASGCAPAPALVRASGLARRYQRGFLWSVRLALALALAAAVMLAISVSVDASSVWAGVEAVCLFAAAVAFFASRIGDFHARWLSCRLLSERLRSAHYLAPTGAEFRAGARLEGVYVGSRENEWVTRASGEVWDGRTPTEPPAALTPEAFEALRSTLAEEWIGGQIGYHKDAARRHRSWARWLERAVVALYLATFCFAVVHALGGLERLSELLGITLPAIGASIGALLTIRQHRALEQRSEQMLDELDRLQVDVAAAAPRELAALAADAARVIAQETGDWLGAMWFLEMEHL